VTDCPSLKPCGSARRHPMARIHIETAAARAYLQVRHHRPGHLMRRAAPPRAGFASRASKRFPRVDRRRVRSPCQKYVEAVSVAPTLKR
jgi:hypothetical protein